MSAALDVAVITWLVGTPFLAIWAGVKIWRMYPTPVGRTAAVLAPLVLVWYWAALFLFAFSGAGLNDEAASEFRKLFSAPAVYGGGSGNPTMALTWNLLVMRPGISLIVPSQLMKNPSTRAELLDPCSSVSKNRRIQSRFGCQKRASYYVAVTEIPDDLFPSGDMAGYRAYGLAKQYQTTLYVIKDGNALTAQARTREPSNDGHCAVPGRRGANPAPQPAAVGCHCGSPKKGCVKWAE